MLRPGGVRRGRVGLAGAVAVAAAVLVWMRMPIGFDVEAGAEQATLAGHLGDVIEASAGRPAAVRFSEGSSIVLERGGRLRVLSLASDGARVLVQEGAADVAIAHGRGPGKWRFEAGPVVVSVTGTMFRMQWDPTTQSFGIDLKEGSVIVGGDCLPAPRVVRRGENVRIACGEAPATALAKRPPPAPVPAAVIETDLGPSRLPPLAAHHDARSRRAARHIDWSGLVAVGRYAEGVRAADRAGWSRICRIANAVELLALADAARLSDQANRAAEVLLALRRRFPGSSSASTAAFSLGRMAFDRHGAYSDAARWFAIYLDEQPRGPLMGDAIGRLMEARYHAGDHVAARRDADAYLQRFREGPYAGAARLILAATSSANPSRTATEQKTAASSASPL